MKGIKGEKKNSRFFSLSRVKTLGRGFLGREGL